MFKPPIYLKDKWMFYILWIAGIYNIVWGTSVILFPTLFFDLTIVFNLQKSLIASSFQTF